MTRMYHPQVGELELHYEKLQIAGTDGQTLTIYHADPGSRTSQALEQLATVAPKRFAEQRAQRQKPALTPNRNPRCNVALPEDPSARSSRGKRAACRRSP